MADLCLFYAKEDRPVALELIKILGEFWNVWWDQEIDEGRWEIHVTREIPLSSAAIVLWSKTSIAKEIVSAECHRAISLEKPLFMIRIDDAPLPMALAGRASIDAIGWRGKKGNAGVEELISKIKNRIPPSVPRAIGNRESKRPKTFLLAGKTVPVPAFLRSVSSFETQLSPRVGIDILELHETSHILISAYDMASTPGRGVIKTTLQKMKERGVLVVMDSGNYEAYRKSDFKSRKNPNGWSREKFVKALKTVPFDMAFCYDNFEPIGNPKKIIKDIVSRMLADQKVVPKKIICPIVHVPRDKKGRRQIALLPELVKGVAEQLRPEIIGIPERELGDGIVQRAKNVHILRKELSDLDRYQPIHLLGTGNPWSIAVFAKAGADMFDGLEWCRTVANDETGLLYHFQQYDFFKYQALLAKSPMTKRSVDDSRVPYFAKVAFHNLEVFNNWMQKLTEYNADNSLNNFLAQKLADQYHDLRNALPEVFK